MDEWKAIQIVINSLAQPTDFDHICCDGYAVSSAANGDGEDRGADAIDDDFVVHLD